MFARKRMRLSLTNPLKIVYFHNAHLINVSTELEMTSDARQNGGKSRFVVGSSINKFYLQMDYHTKCQS